MDTSTFYVDTVTEPVVVTQVCYVGDQELPIITTKEVLDADSLEGVLNASRNQAKCQYQIISICQGNSWNPLEITKSMVEHIAKALGTRRIDDIAKNFYQRDADTEETFCMPWTESFSENKHEALYTVRYPEYKASEDRWALRQTGLYHLLDNESRSLYILLEPTPRSGLRRALPEYLQKHGSDIRRTPMWLHTLLLSTYFPAWRDYTLFIEAEFLPIAGSTFANYIKQNLLVGHDDLGTLYRLKYRSQQIPVILGYLQDSLSHMQEYVTTLPERVTTQENKSGTLCTLKEIDRECVAYARSATYLEGRISSTTAFLTTTLSLRDQFVAKEQSDLIMEQTRKTVEQNQNMIRLNKSAVFITSVTLVYLPSSWLATFFGMNFFGLNEQTHRMVGSSMIWIYIVASVVLTGATFVLYYFLLHRNGKLFVRIEPTAKLPLRRQFTQLSRRLSSRKMDDTELCALPV